MICFYQTALYVGPATVTVASTPYTWPGTSAGTAVGFLWAFAEWYTATVPSGSCSVTFARNPVDSGIIATLWFNHPTVFAPSGDFTTRSGIPAQTTTHAAPGTASMLGSWSPAQTNGYVTLRLDYPMVEGNGDASGVGAIRQTVPGSGQHRPTVEAIGTAQDAARLTQVLMSAGSFRQGSVLDYRARGLPVDGPWWGGVHFGPVTRTSAGHNLYRFSFDVAR